MIKKKNIKKLVKKMSINLQKNFHNLKILKNKILKS